MLNRNGGELACSHRVW